MTIDFRSNLKTRAAVVIVATAVLGALVSGCLDYQFVGPSGPRLQEGTIRIALTNSSARGADSSSPEAVEEATYCRVIIQRIEIADASKVWIPVVLDNVEPVDLLDPNDALDKLSFLHEGMGVRSQSYYYLKLYLTRLESDAFDPESYSPNGPLVKEITTSGFQVNAGRCTIMMIDLDAPAAFKEVSHPVTPDFDVESVIWLNKELILIPYSMPVDGRQGVWTTGEEYGYFQDTTLFNVDGTVVGNYLPNSTITSGNYTFSAGRFRGIRGTFTLIRNGFTTPATKWKGDITSALNWDPFSPAFVPRYFVRTVEFINSRSIKIIMVWANSSDWGFWTADSLEGNFWGTFYHLDEEGNSMPFGSHDYTQFDTDDYSYRWFEYPSQLRQTWWADRWETGPTVDDERAESTTLFGL